jgi:hypothetical protein
VDALAMVGVLEEKLGTGGDWNIGRSLMRTIRRERNLALK